MEQKLKEYCEHELMVFNRFGGDKKAMIDRCYGALMFYDFYNGYNEVVVTWWNNEMLPELNQA